MNFFPFHVGDYTARTAHLEPMEDLAYRRCLDLYYLREGALPAEPAEVARLIRLRAHVSDVEAVLREFFELTSAGWVQARCDKEIAKFQAMAAGGKAGAAKRWSKGGDSPPISPPIAPPIDTLLPTKNQEPVTKKEQEQKTTAAIASAVSAPPKRAVRKCPADFEVTAELQEFAASHPGVDWQTETDKFRDHTFKNAISEWGGAWRNWIRRSAENGPNTRASPMSFRERDELAAIARVHEMTGGLVSAKPNTPRRPDALQEVFDARTAARRTDRLAVCPPSGSLRLDLVEQVGGD